MHKRSDEYDKEPTAQTGDIEIVMDHLNQRALVTLEPAQSMPVICHVFELLHVVPAPGGAKSDRIRANRPIVL